MNKIMSEKQRGVVLIFTLVMLLLLTLLGVNMIQQNRLQFMMAANSQNQTTKLSSAENILKKAENFIELQRYQDKSTFSCNTPGTPPTYKQLLPIPAISGDITGNLGLPDTTSISAEILQTACISFGNEIPCTYNNNNPPDDWSSSELLCNQKYIQGNATTCPTEVYTIRIIDPDPVTSSQRIIESKYAIRCDK